MKQWLLEIRNVSGLVGKLALEAMDYRTRKWRSRREKDPMLRLSRVGSAVEMVIQERSDSELYPCPQFIRSINILLLVNVLDSEKLKVDFTPLYQCIHIYTTLDSIDDLRRSYQADRKVRQCSAFSSRQLNLNTGAIRPYFTGSASARLPTQSNSGNMRIFYHRIACS